MAHPYEGKRADKVGKARASRIAGKGAAGFGPPSEEHQSPQLPEDRHGPKYDNDASGWVRGAGESAEGKPGFDKTHGR